MKNIMGLSAILLLTGFNAQADALLTCKDSTGHEVFQGYIGTEKAVESENFSHEQEVPFTFAVPAKPVIGLDRATFKRKTGIELKECKGPYAKVYEKQPAGKMRCSSGRIKSEEAIGAEDAQVFVALALPKVEADCSVILPKEKMLGLPSN